MALLNSSNAICHFPFSICHLPFAISIRSRGYKAIHFLGIDRVFMHTAGTLSSVPIQRHATQESL
jgi:hypothetical protein